jgi:hypothetical protein
MAEGNTWLFDASRLTGSLIMPINTRQARESTTKVWQQITWVYARFASLWQGMLLKY